MAPPVAAWPLLEVSPPAAAAAAAARPACLSGVLAAVPESAEELPAAGSSQPGSTQAASQPAGAAALLDSETQADPPPGGLLLARHLSLEEGVPATPSEEQQQQQQETAADRRQQPGGAAPAATATAPAAPPAPAAQAAATAAAAATPPLHTPATALQQQQLAAERAAELAPQQLRFVAETAVEASAPFVADTAAGDLLPGRQLPRFVPGTAAEAPAFVPETAADLWPALAAESLPPWQAQQAQQQHHHLYVPETAAELAPYTAPDAALSPPLSPPAQQAAGFVPETAVDAAPLRQLFMSVPAQQQRLPPAQQQQQVLPRQPPAPVPSIGGGGLQVGRRPREQGASLQHPLYPSTKKSCPGLTPCFRTLMLPWRRQPSVLLPPQQASRRRAARAASPASPAVVPAGQPALTRLSPDHLPPPSFCKRHPMRASLLSLRMAVTKHSLGGLDSLLPGAAGGFDYDLDPSQPSPSPQCRPHAPWGGAPHGSCGESVCCLRVVGSPHPLPATHWALGEHVPAAWSA